MNPLHAKVTTVAGSVYRIEIGFIDGVDQGVFVIHDEDGQIQLGVDSVFDFVVARDLNFIDGLLVVQMFGFHGATFSPGGIGDDKTDDDLPTVNVIEGNGASMNTLKTASLVKIEDKYGLLDLSSDVYIDDMDWFNELRKN